jgi:hypothetical protein
VTGTAANPQNTTLTGVDQTHLVYPNSEKINSEAFAVDPVSHNLMVFEKNDGDVSRVFSTPDSGWNASGDRTVQQVAPLNLSHANDQLVTSADFSPDGAQTGWAHL